VSLLPLLAFSLLTSLPLNVGHVLLGLQGRVTENGLGGGTGWGPEERVGAEPRRPNGQHIGAGQGLIHTVDVVPGHTSTLVTEEPNLGLPWPPIEVALGPIAIGLAVVAFQAMLLGGLGRTSRRRAGGGRKTAKRKNGTLS